MTAKATSPKAEPRVRMADLFPQMHLWEKLKATGICVLLLIPALTLCWWIVGPGDPLGAVTLVYHPRTWLALPVLLVFATGGSALAALLMGGRLCDFGVFAVGVALTGLSLKGGDLTVLLQYEADVAGARGTFYGRLAVDVVLWTLVFAAGFASSAITEVWISPESDRLQAGPKGAKASKSGFLTKWLQRAAVRTGGSPDWGIELRQGILTLAVTTAVAMVVIPMTAGRPDGPVHAGQVCFAIGLGFWLGAMAANQFCRPALSLWYCLAVPVVALTGHLEIWASPGMPERLAAYSDIITIIPNGLAKGLPLEYLALGPAAAILGLWTSQRVHRTREEAAES
jgi:hypothetical protein